MSFVSRNRWLNAATRLGLRARITAWTASMLGVALVAALVWGHQNLRSVLQLKSDGLLEGKMAELASVIRETPAASAQAKLADEIRREVVAHREEGLVVVVRGAGTSIVAPSSPAAQELSRRLDQDAVQPGVQTIRLPPSAKAYRVLHAEIDVAGRRTYSFDLALDLSATGKLLADFDRRLAAGGLVFLAAAVGGGFFLSRRALEPVARSIETARLLNPADLSARLPVSGADDELDELAHTMNEMLDRLAVYHAQIQQFTADASHELRSPLGAMRTAIEVALQQPRPGEEYRRVLETLGTQCERLSDLVNNLLLLARADAGQVELRRDLVDLGEIIGETVDLYQPVADDQDVTLDWCAPSPVAVRGDRGRLHQLVTNLLDNALKFTDRGGRVTVRLEAERATARLTVADTGVGIASDRLPYIFDRFYQLDAARAGRGAGLGLSICRWIVAAHGGSIEAASQPGRGTVMTVVLPFE
ncbi:MAG TPA: ATP-binding protein [Pirellulales bacterium]|nr:ATP-binding protein [Pirellulales bacterium]